MERLPLPGLHHGEVRIALRLNISLGVPRRGHAILLHIGKAAVFQQLLPIGPGLSGTEPEKEQKQKHNTDGNKEPFFRLFHTIPPFQGF